MATITVTPIKTFVSGETVTPTKLNELSQSTVALTAGTIVDADIASDAVTTAKILDANVTDAKIASGVDASKLTTGTLPIARIADAAVTAAKLAPKVTFPDYAAGVAQNYNTLYQAATDGYLVVRAVGSFVNGIQIVVGTTSSPTSQVWQAGDDINSNTKRAATMLPIPKDIYYKVQPLPGIAAFDAVFVEWYPVVT